MEVEQSEDWKRLKDILFLRREKERRVGGRPAERGKEEVREQINAVRD